MEEHHRRICNACGYVVTYHIIDDAHDPHTVTQFVGVIIKGTLAGSPAVIDHCPRCDAELTLSSTTKPDPDKIKEFFFEVMLKGFVVSAETQPGLLPGWVMNTYEKGPLTLVDTWYKQANSYKSVGMTLIHIHETLIWKMDYWGNYNPRVIPVLTEALRIAYTAKEFIGGRGPKKFNFNDFRYENTPIDESFEKGHGSEIITFKESSLKFGGHNYQCFWVW